MGKTAFLFSGQGSQKSGMGRALFDAFPEVREVYEMASEALSRPVSELGFDCSEEKLAMTIYAQPAIFTLSLALARLFFSKGLRPDAIAGFSLGEITALAASGAVSLDDGFKIIRLRSEAMQRAAETGGGKMAAVLGLSPEIVESVCGKVSGDVLPVNYNSPSQTVIAGTAEACDQACEALMEAGASKCVPLKVNAAFHSPMMAEAAAEFRSAISDMAFLPPEIPLYSNVTGAKLDVSDLPCYLETQMKSPVQFVREIEAMRADGFTSFIELGPGKTLAGLVRQIDRGLSVRSCDTPEAFSKVCAEFM